MRPRASSSAASASPAHDLTRRRDLLRRHFHAGAVEIELVEFERVVLQRAIAARGDIGDDGAHRGFNVGRCFALGVEKGAKFLREIAGADVEADGHDVS